jgi:ribonuclease P protein component
VLPAAARVRRSEDFTAVLGSGRRAGAGALVVHLLEPTPPRASTVATRAGFVVGRGVGNAVLRNRTRRRLRHLVRGRLASLPAGSTLVVRALPGSAGLRSDELSRQLDAGLRRVTRTPA